MKKMLLLFLLSISVSLSNANKEATWAELNTVNQYWSSQSSKHTPSLPEFRQRTDKEWIAVHLSLVTDILRTKNVAGLNTGQLRKRNVALNYLKGYAQAGYFPQNKHYAYRTPIFIDEQDNFCAVGYLLKTSGNEALARQIAATNNLAYVQDMNFKTLDLWADEHGFTKEELAWIQPGYPPAQLAQAVGGGVQGVVYSLLTSTDAERLYIGGNFNMVNAQLAAANIAYLTGGDGEFTWHTMGAGVNGTVYTIKEFEGKLFVAGNFTEAGGQPVNNVAYWDGTSWHAAGCTYGTVNALVVYMDELYACGSFDVCAALSEVNFAKWTGSAWQQIPGLAGRVNTMEVLGDDLWLGGKFAYNNQTLNVIRYNRETQFQLFANSISNEVRDFEMFKDTIYAACKIIDDVDTSSLLMKLVNDNWESSTITTFGFAPQSEVFAFNTFCTDGNSLMVGGDFIYVPGMGTYATNCLDVYGTNSEANWFLVDSAIYDMAMFKGKLFAGGKFKYGGNGIQPLALNSIAYRTSIPTSVPVIVGDREFEVWPNPIEKQDLTISNSFNASSVSFTNMLGREVFEAKLSTSASKQQIGLPSMPSGLYVVCVKNATGITAHKKVIIK